MTCETYFYNNLMRSDATSFSLSNVDASYPTLNLKDHRTARTVRTTSASMALVIDLGSALDVDSILIQGNMIANTIGFTGNLTIEAHTSDSWGAPSFSTTLTPNTEYNYGIKTFATEIYQFWRLSCSGSTYAELSNVFLGEKFQPTTNFINFGWSASWKDMSKKVTNPYGQVFIDNRPTMKTIRADYKMLNKDEMTSLQDMYKANSITEPVWFYVFDPETSTVVNDPEEFMMHGFLNARPTLKNTSFGYFDTGFSIDEIL